MKRIVLFVLTNVAVMVVMSVVLSVLGLDRYLHAQGLNLGGLLAFSLVVGFTGSIFSLLISKPMAKWSTGAQVIEQPANSTELWLVDTVRRLATQAGIGMPEVAVSTGLLQNMTREEVEAVLGHEVAHIANGDMVTMTLLQGVVNTFVVFLSRVVGYLVDRWLSRDGEQSTGIGYMVTVIICQIVFGLLASIIVAWFSRQREFRADAGSAQLLGSKRPMINALARLGQMHEASLPQSVAALGINKSAGVMEWFASHPPIEERIAALQQS